MERVRDEQRSAGRRWECSIVTLFWCLLVPACLWVGRASADSGPLRAEVLPLAMRPRTAAPMFVDVKLHSRQRAMLDGVLELQIFSAGELLFRQQTRPLALAPGATTQRILILPSKSATDLRLRFLAGKSIFELGQFPLSSGYSLGPQYLIGICGGSAPTTDGRPRLWQALRPEWLVPTDSRGERQITSTPVWMTPEELPTAFGLCAFDLLVLESRSFTALDSRQLDQLAMWVEAGGSLCIAPQAPLPSEYRTFLEKLVNQPGRPPAIVFQADGAFAFSNGTNALGRPGLGRVAIVSNPPATEAEVIATPWIGVLSFLSKKQFAAAEDPAATLPSVPKTYVPSRPHLAQGVLMGLLPRTSRAVPIPLVIALLGTFVLLAGPGEWIVLGRLRKRRWTWVTFPFFAVVFALAAVRAAEHYLGRTHRQSKLIITDLGAEGRILRQNTLTLHFAGARTTMTSEVRQGIGVSCMAGRGANEEGTVSLYQGTMPSQYRIQQPLKQWSPHLSRTMAFREDTQLPDATWDGLNVRNLASQGLPTARSWVEQLKRQGWNVQFLNGQQISTIDQTPQERIPYQQLIQGLSRWREGDAPHWAATFSPSGAADLADLAMVDPTNPREWLVVATKASPQTLHVVRRLYHDE